MIVSMGYIIASNLVAKDHQRVGYLYREAPCDDRDSGWRVFSGSENQEYADNPSNFAMYNAETIIKIDPYIRTVLDHPYPVAFELDRHEFVFKKLPSDH